ncbi:MAG TPA: hypothetical protein VMI11_10655 [Actinomycetes bacterium]|nr:hypothetical protein [Actinomycetes bacterium]
MSINTMPLGGPSLAGLTLKAHAVAVPALSSHVRPALVLAEQDARRLLDAARSHEVTRGGLFACSPAGVQVWDRPWTAPDSPGDAVHLGSVDWSYDTPVKHYVTIYRAMVTAAGVERGVTTETVLKAVLDLTGIPLDGARITMAIPPPRDPFRRTA